MSASLWGLGAGRGVGDAELAGADGTAGADDAAASVYRGTGGDGDMSPGPAVVEYHFPVVVEVREAEPPDLDALAEIAARRLLTGLWG